MIDFNCFKVTGYTLIESDFIPSRRTDHEYLVTFKSPDENKEKHENYLSWYEGWQPERDHRPWHWFCPEMCAIALVTMHLRERMQRLSDEKVERVFPAAFPQKTPDASDAGHRLWEISAVKSEVYTETNAGGDLYLACQHQKMRVQDARSLVHTKFNGKYYDWEKALRAFRKLGGRHTDLYLRMEH